MGYWLLAVLCQLYYQPSLLRTVQRHIQKDIQEPAPVPVQKYRYKMRRKKTTEGGMGGERVNHTARTGNNGRKRGNIVER